MRKRLDPIRNFFSKVQITEGCWYWSASKNKKGYGNFNVNEKFIAAHRFSWKIIHGDIPQGMCVLHRCDNPSCVRVDHLFLGTNADNVADRVAKGRSSGGSLRGEMHPMSKLTRAEVEFIRSEAKRKKFKQRQLAATFGITQPAVSMIQRGVNW